MIRRSTRSRLHWDSVLVSDLWPRYIHVNAEIEFASSVQLLELLQLNQVHRMLFKSHFPAVRREGSRVLREQRLRG